MAILGLKKKSVFLSLDWLKKFTADGDTLQHVEQEKAFSYNIKH